MFIVKLLVLKLIIDMFLYIFFLYLYVGVVIVFLLEGRLMGELYWEFLLLVVLGEGEEVIGM